MVRCMACTVLWAWQSTCHSLTVVFIKKLKAFFLLLNFFFFLSSFFFFCSWSAKPRSCGLFCWGYRCFTPSIYVMHSLLLFCVTTVLSDYPQCSFSWWIVCCIVFCLSFAKACWLCVIETRPNSDVIILKPKVVKCSRFFYGWECSNTLSTATAVTVTETVQFRNVFQIF